VPALFALLPVRQRPAALAVAGEPWASPSTESARNAQAFTVVVLCLLLVPHSDNLPLWLLGEEFTLATCGVSGSVALLFLAAFALGCERSWGCHDCPCHKFVSRRCRRSWLDARDAP